MCRFENFVFGGLYAIHPSDDANCLSCGTNLKELMEGKLMIYRGCNGQNDFFDYAEPFVCPSCGYTLVYHQDTCEPSNVTEEFAKLLDKK